VGQGFRAIGQSPSKCTRVVPGNAAARPEFPPTTTEHLLLLDFLSPMFAENSTAPRGPVFFCSRRGAPWPPAARPPQFRAPAAVKAREQVGRALELRTKLLKFVRSVGLVALGALERQAAARPNDIWMVGTDPVG
jgi:hypothetical protein